MTKKLLIGSVFANILFAVFIFVGSINAKDGKLVVVTREELACLSSWHKKTYDEKPIYGPKMLMEHYIIQLDEIPNGASFESELSGCFYSAISTIGLEGRGLNSKVEFLKSQGYENVGFYKSAYESDVHFFAK